MRHLPISALIAIFILAACGGEPTTTPAPTQDADIAVSPVVEATPEADATQEATPDEPILTLPPMNIPTVEGQPIVTPNTSDLPEPEIIPLTTRIIEPTYVAFLTTIEAMGVEPMPFPGTLVATPYAPETTGEIIFTRLVFTQTGGNPDQPMIMIELLPDGTLTRDGVVSQVSAAMVKHVNDTLIKIGAYNIQGIFTGPDIRPETIEYTLALESDTASISIYAHDNLTPPELAEIFIVLLSLGR